MEGVLRVSLQGGVDLNVDGARVPPPASRRARSLLAWLALHPGEHPRSEVAARFWPDVLESSARTSLRGALLELRRALGPAEGCLHTGRTTVGFAHGDGVWVDALEVDRLAREGQLDEALALAEGELLAGVDDDWVYDARESQRDMLLEIAETLARRADAEGDAAAAAAFSRRQVKLDPLSEDAHRGLIERLAAAGDRAAALKAYDVMCDRLRRDLGLAPGPETRALVERLRGEEAGAAAGTVETVPLPPGMVTPDEAIVGRVPELEALEGNLERARAGEARIVLLAGDAGMGKTRLAGEFSRRAHAGGANVLFGRCDEEALAPYQPWVEALRHYIAHADAGNLGRWAGAAAPELARLVPGLADRIPDLPEPLRAEPDTERYRLFEAIAGLLCGIGSTAPTVVVLDDLHWADKPTLLLLRHVVRSASGARLLVVGTYRESEVEPQHPLGQALVALRRDAAFERVPVEGLPERDVAVLVDRRRGGAGDERFVRALREETEGNPFFIEEILRSLPGDGAGDGAGGLGGAALPEGVRDAVRRRLERLSEGSRATLTLASVIGAAFSIELLEAVGEMDGDELLAALDEAVQARVVVEVPGTLGRYTFRHALIRATLYEELSRTRRARLHLRVGEVLERRSDASRYGELAHHFLAAAQLGTAGQAVRYSALAAEHATEQLAHEEAAEHLRNGLEALGEEGVDPSVRLRLLLSLGEAESRAGETGRARDAFESAAAIAREMGDGERLALAALGFAGQAWQSFGEVDDRAVELLEDALARLDDADSSVRARTLARLAVALYFAGAGERLDAMTEEALAIARRVEDPAALAAAIEARLYAIWHADAVEERLAGGTELLALAQQGDRSELAAQARRWRIVPLLDLGRWDEAVQEIEAHAELARTLGQPYELMYTKVFEGMRALFTGDFAAAQQLAGEILSSDHGRPGADATQFHGLHMLTLTQACGGIEQLEAPILEYIERYPGIPAWRAAIPMIHVATGRIEEAAAAVEELSRDDFAILPRDANWYPAMAWSALACRDAGTPEQARRLHSMLVPYADRGVVIGAGGAVWGSFSLYLGMLAARAGDARAAARHYEDELGWTAARGARPWHAQAQAAYGELLLTAGKDDRAQELLGEAAATAAALGMGALAARIETVAPRAAQR